MSESLALLGQGLETQLLEDRLSSAFRRSKKKLTMSG